jgi:hypothetical protein
MEHQLCNAPAPETFTCGIWGASSPFAGAPAERSFWGRADVLVLTGTPASLATIRYAFSILPGRFALGVVREIDRHITPAPDQLALF